MFAVPFLFYRVAVEDYQSLAVVNPHLELDDARSVGSEEVVDIQAGSEDIGYVESLKIVRQGNMCRVAALLAARYEFYTLNIMEVL